MSRWSPVAPWCFGCGRIDRFHVRQGLCYHCADKDLVRATQRLALDVRGELLELPGQCRDHLESNFLQELGRPLAPRFEGHRALTREEILREVDVRR